MSLPLAVCLLVIDPKGRVLACSRRDDHTLFGLPGGKVDPGETPSQSILREALEETGYVIPEDTELREVYREVCAGEQDYDCITYSITYSAIDETTRIAVDPSEGRVEWVTWDVLASGPFAPYNQRVRAVIESD